MRAQKNKGKRHSAAKNKSRPASAKRKPSRRKPEPIAQPAAENQPDTYFKAGESAVQEKLAGAHTLGGEIL